MPELHLLERVQAAVPQERVISAFGTEARPQGGGNVAVPPKEHRDVIFEGQRMPGDGWGAFWGTLGGLLTSGVMDNPSPSLARKLDRETARKRNYPYYGEWTSAAGQLLSAVQPRSKAGVYPVLAITEQHMYIVCIQRKRGSLAKLGTATHVTTGLNRQDLGWVRERGDAAFEFGFRDGSWATLSVFSADDLPGLFPDMLTKETPIPW